MDLPTCPSCGQSVLDDDAQDCPFCGAAMDGSSAPRSPSGDKAKAGTASRAKPEEKADADDDDPFAIAQTPAAQKVLQCAPKPMKGRLHRVVCPMCDTQGFIPKAAVGRQVRCANRKCLVPVFEAAGKEEEGTPRAPARVSDGETAPAKKETKGSSEKKPMLLYGIVGAVLLAATFGLLAYLNKEPPDKLGPVNIAMPDAEPDEPDVKQSPETNVPVATDYRAKAGDLVQEMVKTARIQGGNRDKPYCRSLTGDAFLRLGMNTEADAEFAQMNKISRSAGLDNAYYQIAPLVADFWKLHDAGDGDGADKRLVEAKSFSKAIPKSGLLAVESTVTLATAMAESGETDAALQLIAGQQRDLTIELQQDSVRRGVWMATSAVLRDVGQMSIAPEEVFAWHEPLKTGVGLQLSAHRRWKAAVAWAGTLEDPLTCSDTFAIVASQMIAVDASATDQQALVAAAESKGPLTILRVVSVLSQKEASSSWDRAKSLAAALPALPQSIPEGVEAVIGVATPDLSATRHHAEAIADFAIAAVRNGDEAAAVDSINRVYKALVSNLAPTAELRKACMELKRDEDGVKDRVAKALSLRNDSQQIQARFFAYRKGVDRQAIVAERRRFALLQILARVINHGGLSAVKQALAAEDGLLEQEVCLDQLKGLLVVAAASSGEQFPEIANADASLRVPIARVEPLLETKIVGALVEAWTAYLASAGISAVAKLEQARGLVGVRATNAVYMTQLASLNSKSVKEHFDAIGELKDPQWREVCLGVSSRILTERGMLDDIQPALADAAKTPTQKLVAIYGMVRGAIKLAAAKSE